MNEYLVVFNEFIAGYGSITSNIVSFFRGVSGTVVPILMISAACSVLITFYKNIVK